MFEFLPVLDIFRGGLFGEHRPTRVRFEDIREETRTFPNGVKREMRWIRRGEVFFE